MTNALDYASRLEKKIDVLQSEVKLLTDIVTRLSVINENHISTSERNTQDIKDLTNRIDNLDRKDASRDGSNNTFKGVVGILHVVVFAVCGWLFSSINDLKENNATMQSEIQHLTNDISDLERKVGK